MARQACFFSGMGLGGCMKDITKCMKCGCEVSGAEARTQMFGRIDSSKPLLCKKCRIEVRNKRRAELRAKKKAEYEDIIACKKQNNADIESFGDIPKKKYKITNAAKLVEAQDKYAEKRLQKEIDDMIGDKEL